MYSIRFVSEPSRYLIEQGSDIEALILDPVESHTLLYSRLPMLDINTNQV